MSSERALPTLSLLSRPLLQRQEGGTRGTGFLYWEGMPAASQGIRYTGLIHAADWLPSVVAVSRHDIAAIWVAFFSRWQRYRC